MKSIILITLLLALSISPELICQNTIKDTKRKLLETEVLEYEVNYKLGPAWINAGSFFLSSETLISDTATYIQFKSESYTSKNWQWLYNIHSKYVAISDTHTFETIDFHQITEYGKHRLSHKYDYFNDSILISTNKDGVLSDTLIVKEQELFDALSALYYIRTLKFDSMEIGDSIEIRLINGNKKLTQTVYYNGLASLEKGEDLIECFKFSTFIVNNKIINEDSPVEVWVSKTKDPLPLQIIADIRVGNIIISLVNFTNNIDAFWAEEYRQKK